MKVRLTKRAFRDWLTRMAADSDIWLIGNRGDSSYCPIAQYLHDECGYCHPIVDGFNFRDGYGPMAHVYNKLPSWAQKFVTIVDNGSAKYISPKLALRYLNASKGTQQ